MSIRKKKYIATIFNYSEAFLVLIIPIALVVLSSGLFKQQQWTADSQKEVKKSFTAEVVKSLSLKNLPFINGKRETKIVDSELQTLIDSDETSAALATSPIGALSGELLIFDPL